MSNRGPGRANASRPAKTTRPGASNTRPKAGGDRTSSAKPARKNSTPQVLRMAFVLLVFVLVCVFLFPTVRGYISQRQEIAALQQDIENQKRDIEALEGQISAWEDPDYVEQQARERLRFVRPGETAFTVLDDTGAQLTEAIPGMAPVSNDIHELGPWYGEVWESIKVSNEGLPE
ncbi:septum formation initiator family protein [Ornithinimicrobium sp. INDO-MA30-4]|uniref:FtsB family cell division protein n=1 Tax=Ornithinimicrobium sp. INDO-MA30-4 TaxID=2908651 RepID=UPI001F270D58|nr:septum formation initiator family protein [Ornithinimicrobium sp. INDO-MA30-4]UJH70599.1 septum formation initiator family protein [Ornithinimicrobium sp. INDO-MA30-4]